MIPLRQSVRPEVPRTGLRRFANGTAGPRFLFKIIPSTNTLLTTVESGGLNVWAGVPVQDVARIQKVSGAKLQYTHTSLFEMIYTNQRNPILKDQRVRQALEMGINRKAIVSTILSGHASLLAADQSPASWGYDSSLRPWPYDPARAKELLQQAGWKLGSDGYMHKGGQTLQLVSSTTAGNTTREATQRLNQTTLKGIGVKIEIHNHPANALFGSVLPSGTGGTWPRSPTTTKGPTPPRPRRTSRPAAPSTGVISRIPPWTACTRSRTP